jgi:hypothetical protein
VRIFFGHNPGTAGCLNRQLACYLPNNLRRALWIYPVLADHQIFALRLFVLIDRD